MSIECLKRTCDHWVEDKAGHCTNKPRLSKKCPDAVFREKKSKLPVRSYVAIREKSVCQCGNEKKTGKAFCSECKAKLTNDIRADLCLRIADGFEEAYDRAMEILGNE